MTGFVWPITSTDIVIVSLTLLIFLWDAVLLKHNEADTVSWRITWWAKRAPIVAVAFGVLIGHLFWPNHAYCQ